VESLNPFEFIDAVGASKIDVVANSDDPSEAIKKYSPWLSNKHFSYFNDSVLHANEMNISHGLDPYLQYRYYLSVLPPRKRFTKWSSITDGDSVAAVSEWYGINRRRAREAIKILPKSAVEDIVKAVKARDEDGRGSRTNRDKVA
jgi:hypothetical protein